VTVASAGPYANHLHLTPDIIMHYLCSTLKLVRGAGGFVLSLSEQVGFEIFLAKWSWLVQHIDFFFVILVP